MNRWRRPFACYGFTTTINGIVGRAYDNETTSGLDLHFSGAAGFVSMQ